MSQGKRGRSHTFLYILTGLFAGILIGFGTALMIQNRVADDIIPGLNGSQDETEIQSGADRPGGSRSRVASVDKTYNTAELEAGGEMYADPDSLFVADSFEDTVTGGLPEGNDIIRREEMIGVKRIKLQIADEHAGKRQGSQSQTDTLLTALTSVKIPEGYYQEYILEFWQNPLNYKGYRVTRDKIVLFGMPVDQNYTVRFAEGNLLLVAGKQHYVLKESSDFIPLIPRRQ